MKKVIYISLSVLLLNSLVNANMIDQSIPMYDEYKALENGGFMSAIEAILMELDYMQIHLKQK